MTPAQVKALPPGSPQLSVLQAALDLGDAPNLLSQGFTAESIMNVINTARIKLLTGITNVPSDTLPPAPAPQ
jgi:sulfite exporter TauE/SafE